jgi:hypothetical protein
MIGAFLKRVTRVLALLMIGGTMAGATSDWPPLPSKGFITARPAQKSDVSNGDAVFVAAVGDLVIGKPLPISIPQYALLHGKHERVIVVQAEEANGMKLFGVRGLDGKETVATETDLELLGTQIPIQ